MDSVKRFAIPSHDFLDSAWFLLTSRILGNKLQVFETGNCDWIMDEEDFITLGSNCEREEAERKKKSEYIYFPDENEEEKDEDTRTMSNNVPFSVVEFLNIREVYEKVQSRAGGGSSQRITEGNIKITATSEGQLCGIDVYVQRLPEAAALCGDTNGRIPLSVKHEAHFQNQQTFSVDLDSVYNSSNGTPVYKLATVDSERRNIFILIVCLKFIDGTRSEPFLSKPFLIRSRKSGSRARSTEA